MTRPTDPLGGPASAGAATPARRQAARWGVASLIVALVATLLVPTTAAANEADTATAGATDASTAVVAVLDADGVRRCAGAVVGELHVLTAAHCVNYTSEFQAAWPTTTKNWHVTVGLNSSSTDERFE